MMVDPTCFSRMRRIKKNSIQYGSASTKVDDWLLSSVANVYIQMLQAILAISNLSYLEQGVLHILSRRMKGKWKVL